MIPRQKGFGYPLIGMDEVGRGAWAGPFVACALFVGEDHHCVAGVRDSNELSARRREQLSVGLRARHQWGLGVVSVEELNTIGMARAQVVVFERAVKGLGRVEGKLG